MIDTTEKQFQREVFIEGKQRYLADIILHRWTSLLEDWLN